MISLAIDKYDKILFKIEIELVKKSISFVSTNLFDIYLLEYVSFCLIISSLVYRYMLKELNYEMIVWCCKKRADCSNYTHTHTHTHTPVYISGAETGLVLLVPGTTNNSVNVIQNGLKIIH